jgi:ABC-type xylose transport system permease subunit
MDSAGDLAGGPTGWLIDEQKVSPFSGWLAGLLVKRKFGILVVGWLAVLFV